jgi:hypothetical protein
MIHTPNKSRQGTALPRTSSIAWRPILLWAGGVVALLAVVVICLYVSGWLTGEMLKDRGYYLWTHRKGGYEQKYLEAFARDSRFQHRFMGEALDSLKAYFPHLYGGGGYNPEKLRKTNPGRDFPLYKGARLQVYWLDASQWGRTYCVLVLDGEIKDFFFVERG